MNFKTEIFPEKSDTQINFDQNILTIGSCFAENIAQYFKRYLFSVIENPFGVLYNPASIYNSLNLLQFDWEELDFEKHLVLNQSEWHSFFHNSDFSHHEKDVVLENIKQQLLISKEYLYMTDWAIITLGTSFVFNHKKENFIVSNCHKFPSDTFERKMLSVNENVEKLMAIYSLLKHFNPEMKIILTVSPVRHWRDGAVDNQKSKSALILAVNEIIEQTMDVMYFPSYEIMMDDLRDYRYYAEDMLHPNNIAVKYIWNKFIISYFDANTLSFIEKVEPLRRSAEHRARNPYSPKHLEFIENQKRKLESLKQDYPSVNFDEIDIF